MKLRPFCNTTSARYHFRHARRIAAFHALLCSLIVIAACSSTTPGEVSSYDATQPETSLPETEAHWLDDAVLAVSVYGAKEPLETDASYLRRAKAAADQRAGTACKQTPRFQPNHDANLVSGMGDSSRYMVRVYGCRR